MGRLLFLLSTEFRIYLTDIFPFFRPFSEMDLDMFMDDEGMSLHFPRFYFLCPFHTIQTLYPKMKTLITKQLQVNVSIAITVLLSLDLPLALTICCTSLMHPKDLLAY